MLSLSFHKTPHKVSQSSGEMTLILSIHLQATSPNIFRFVSPDSVQKLKAVSILQFNSSGQSEEYHGTIPNSSPQLLPTSVWEQHD